MPRPIAPTCHLANCGEPHYAKGWCKAHYYQQRRGKQPSESRSEYTDRTAVCAAADCEVVFRLRSVGSPRLYCSRRCRDRVVKRKMRAVGWVPVHQRDDSPRCKIEGCDKGRFVHGMCSMHAERVKKYGDPSIVKHDRRPGEWRASSQGYVYRFINGQKQLQHRVVMEDVLGRPLLPRENVHHRNGRRDDNRAENLELWVKPQATGQRVEDLVAWVLDRYPDYVKAALRSSTQPNSTEH